MLLIVSYIIIIIIIIIFFFKQTALYGTGHIYNCDTFNEMSPSSGDLTYLGNVAKAIFSAMTHVDSQAVWLVSDIFISSVFKNYTKCNLKDNSL